MYALQDANGNVTALVRDDKAVEREASGYVWVYRHQGWLDPATGQHPLEPTAGGSATRAD